MDFSKVKKTQGLQKIRGRFKKLRSWECYPRSGNTAAELTCISLWEVSHMVTVYALL